MAPEAFKSNETDLTKVRFLNLENVREAVFLLSSALNTFERHGIKNSSIGPELAKLEKTGNPKNVSATFNIDHSTYSVRLKTEAATKIFTLRVGGDFTELSYEKNNKFVEILREEKDGAKGKVRHETFA
jgi:hypothetical protein